ncbi:MAG: RNA polymerase sigma factor (sigma-70 family) [Patiriisocius sp.]|jgi:RNA polymerase sigma factor (sigma-70 family)
MSNKETTKQQELNDQVNINLLIKCREGNRLAQMELYRQLSKSVYNTCLRILRDKESAEDMMQETFIKVFKGLEKFEGRSMLMTWVKRIAINLCLNEVKKNKLDYVEAQEWNVIEEEDEEYEPAYDIKKVKEFINELPEGYRVILTLYLIEGYKHDEIAKILKISVGTSRSQYMRGKKKLKERYLSWEEGEKIKEL